MQKITLLFCAIVLAIGAATTLAHAEPKTVILDNCAKVEVENRVNIGAHGTINLMTVKCTGEARDPEVRKSEFFSISNIPSVNNPQGMARW